MMNQNVQGQGNAVKETTNKIFITGALVKNGLEVINEGEENEAIRGSLTLRTADGSEHDVQYYANRYKKSNGSFTNVVRLFVLCLLNAPVCASSPTR